MKYWKYISWILVLLAGCVKETEWSPDKALPDVIVVDAILTDEVKSHSVYLRFPSQELNSVPYPVTGAAVLISNEDSVWQLTESPSGSGQYITPPWFSARLQKSYTLIIYRNDRVYTATASMVPALPFRELIYLKDDASGLYYIDWVANAFDVADASMWEVLADWSHLPGYEDADSAKTHARLLFYTLPTLDVSEIFAPQMERVLFPAGTIITERCYALQEQHAAFVRELLLETNWTGGLFGVMPANTGTNLSSGAVGYFALCGVYELSLIVAP